MTSQETGIARARLWEIHRMVEDAYISLLEIIPDGCGDEYQPLWDAIQKLKWSIEDELRPVEKK